MQGTRKTGVYWRSIDTVHALQLAHALCSVVPDPHEDVDYKRHQQNQPWDHDAADKDCSEGRQPDAEGLIHRLCQELVRLVQIGRKAIQNASERCHGEEVQRRSQNALQRRVVQHAACAQR
eukprot:11935946-Prorocentrum_lima.AAC.1